MITAVDSSIILDVLVDHPEFADASSQALRQGRSQGSLILCETVLAEIAPAMAQEQLESFLKDWAFTFIPSSRESALLAGSLFREHLRRGGKRERVLPDFLIGAHAQFFAQRLLTRDRGYYRDYFKKLKIWNP